MSIPKVMEDRYLNDAPFHTLVDTLKDAIRREILKPNEIDMALRMAVLQVRAEEQRAAEEGLPTKE